MVGELSAFIYIYKLKIIIILALMITNVITYP